MSGTSGDCVCPGCGSTMDTYQDWKPHDYVSGQCLECGFYYWTDSGRMTLNGVNAERLNLGLQPIKKRRPIKHHFE